VEILTFALFLSIQQPKTALQPQVQTAETAQTAAAKEHASEQKPVGNIIPADAPVVAQSHQPEKRDKKDGGGKAKEPWTRADRINRWIAIGTIGTAIAAIFGLFLSWKAADDALKLNKESFRFLHSPALHILKLETVVPFESGRTFTVQAVVHNSGGASAYDFLINYGFRPMARSEKLKLSSLDNPLPSPDAEGGSVARDGDISFTARWNATDEARSSVQRGAERLYFVGVAMYRDGLDNWYRYRFVSYANPEGAEWAILRETHEFNPPVSGWSDPANFDR